MASDTRTPAKQEALELRAHVVYVARPDGYQILIDRLLATEPEERSGAG